MEPGELAPKVQGSGVEQCDSILRREADCLENKEWGLESERMSSVETLCPGREYPGSRLWCEDREFCLESGECQNGDLFPIVPSLTPPWR